MRRLKAVLRDLRQQKRIKSVTDVGRQAGIAKTTWLEWLNGTRELKPEDFERLEAYVRETLRITTPWVQLAAAVPDDERTQRYKDFGQRFSADSPAVVPRETHDETTDETERRRFMLTPAARQHFNLKRDPFTHDVVDCDGVFFGPVLEQIYDELLDAAQFGRFAALILEVGGGKTTLRKLLIERLRQKGHRISVVEQLDRENLTITRILDALLADFAGKRSTSLGREAKTREVKRMLTTIHEQGDTMPVLMIDEAHALHPSTLRGLKRLYEIEDGFTKLLSIILFGQPQLYSRLGGYDLEEVSSRLEVVLAYGLDTLARQGASGPQPHKPPRTKSCVPAYLKFKLERAGAKDAEHIIDHEAMVAIAKITDVPLRVNTWATRALNFAYETGYDQVTADLVEALNNGRES